MLMLAKLTVGQTSYGGDSKEASAYWLTLEVVAGLPPVAFVPKVPEVYALLRSFMCMRNRNLLLLRADEFTDSPALCRMVNSLGSSGEYCSDVAGGWDLLGVSLSWHSELPCLNPRAILSCNEGVVLVAVSTIAEQWEITGVLI
mmetsp:Transcript_8194/g.50923  ORF Transcript_8194/g.50923 Transcript_8194/m.50923 type:complete len:144 (-) Transcript_8194:3399-3830(-)